MNKAPSILWLECVLDESSLKQFPSVSPASNLWHRGFIQAILQSNCDVYVIGHAYEQIWPLGRRLLIRANDANVPKDFLGKLLGYINIPIFRKISQVLNYYLSIYFYLLKNPRDYVVTYNYSTPVFVVRFLKLLFKFKWVAIVGDGIAPRGANAYVYQNWAYFLNPNSYCPKFHLDGGIPFETSTTFAIKPYADKCIFMYMGALTKHGGVLELAKAFLEISNPNMELWITGRGENAELNLLTSHDNRIKNYGFVSEEELNSLALNATFFVNPRITNFQPNALNYPSKLLHYLGYGKPILSTITEGLSPEYYSFLIPIEDSSISKIKKSLDCAYEISYVEYQQLCQTSQEFGKRKTWQMQARNFLNWLDTISA